MIKQIFKIIWNEKRINGWIVTELILIFTILWFCCDFLFMMGKRYSEPVGFDISNTYQVTLGTVPSSITGEISEEEKIAAFEDVMKRLRANPMVESVSGASMGVPYSGSYNGSNYKVDTIPMPGVWTKWVTPDFFNVFKINFIQGRNFTPQEVINMQTCVLGTNTPGKANEVIIASIDSITNSDNNKSLKVVGIVNKVKRSEYELFDMILYKPVSESELVKKYSWGTEISMRVKAEADSKDFKDRFVEEMRPQLDVKPYFLIDITPFSENRSDYMKWTGYENSIKSTFSILAFLVINIFLGIIGTFWLRTQSRSSEIGLQMALGASRTRIKYTYMTEALVLLFIASIIGFILAINIQETGIFENLGLPMISGRSKNAQAPISQIFINYFITLITLAVIIVIGVWYPSRKASKVSPASVLRGE